jgi:hypothetical protein
MERKGEHQLQIIWEYIPSRSSIPAETKNRLQKGDEHDRKNIS